MGLFSLSELWNVGVASMAVVVFLIRSMCCIAGVMENDIPRVLLRVAIYVIVGISCRSRFGSN